MEKNAVQTDTASREIVIARLLNAPVGLVYEAFTDPKHLINWWGPRGFTNTFKEFELKPGGVWRFTMHGMGMDFPNRIVFSEVVKNKRLAYSHGDDEREHFQVIVTFEEQDGKTLLTMYSLFPTAEARDLVVKEYGAIEGGNQTLDKLEDYLKTM